MKHKLTLLTSAVAAAAALTLASQSHSGAVKQFLARERHDAAIELQAVQNQTKAEQQKAQVVQTEINRLKAECQEGAAAYNNLTTFAKAHMAKPDCSL